jgi:hypothetical protein
MLLVMATMMRKMQPASVMLLPMRVCPAAEQCHVGAASSCLWTCLKEARGQLSGCLVACQLPERGDHPAVVTLLLLPIQQ